jgi:hypothetical protein
MNRHATHQGGYHWESTSMSTEKDKQPAVCAVCLLGLSHQLERQAAMVSWGKLLG